MNAASIAFALNGRKSGRGWSARCPAHDDRDPSLSISISPKGKTLVHCHAGCSQDQVIDALINRGLWNNGGVSQGGFWRRIVRNDFFEYEAKRKALALDIWNSAAPASGTLVERYLAGRAITLPMPDRLRFREALAHAPSGVMLPAMVALVTGIDDKPIGLHRTFLNGDGTGKAVVDPPRMMLGTCRGGAVRFAAPGDVLMIGEGIETCLAAMMATGHPAWAALSVSGLRALDLPNQMRNVIVLADGDTAGEAAAQNSASRWNREGRRVRIARPPQGLDFNDVLVGAFCDRKDVA